MIARYLLLLLVILTGHPAHSMDAIPPDFAVATAPVPVFTSPLAARPDAVLQPDDCGQVRQLAFIALPGTVFTIQRNKLSTRPDLLEVSTNDYIPRPGKKLYIALRNVTLHQTQPPERSPTRPSSSEIQKRLRSAVGLPYIWGGNLREGIQLGQRRLFSGLDCSGLLYEATNGSTPRNTDQLVRFGSGVPVEGLALDGLIARLQPLDLLVWMGHVVIVLDQQTAIESILRCSRGKSGVMITPLKKRLIQLMQSRRPANSWPSDNQKAKLFVVRRWL